MPVYMARNKRGRKCKLTPEVSKAICEALRRGKSYQEAAETAGVSRRTVFNWLQRASEKNHNEFMHFLHSVKKSRCGVPKVNPRPIRRARERHLTPSEIEIMAYREMRRVLDEGRISDEEAIRILEMICDDYDRKIENLSVSWAEVQVPWRGQ